MGHGMAMNIASKILTKSLPAELRVFDTRQDNVTSFMNKINNNKDNKNNKSMPIQVFIIH